MPLLEVIQTRQISASIRLTALHRNPGRSVRGFHPRLRGRCCGTSSDLCFQQGPRLPGVPEDSGCPAGCSHASHPQSASRRGHRKRCRKSRQPRPNSRRKHQQQWRDRGHDPAPTSEAKPLRRYAPEEVDLHPFQGVAGDTNRIPSSTRPNSNHLRLARLQPLTWRNGL